MIKASSGNAELLKLPKTAFLCSRNIPASAVLKCYDWAIEQRDNSTTGGYHGIELIKPAGSGIDLI